MITLKEYKQKSELRLAGKDAASSVKHLTKAGLKASKTALKTAKIATKAGVIIAKTTGKIAQKTTNYIDSKTTPGHRSFRKS